MAECPECEYCCAIGLCCPPEAQLAKLTAMFMRDTGGSEKECQKYARVIVTAREKAQQHHGV